MNFQLMFCIVFSCNGTNSVTDRDLLTAFYFVTFYILALAAGVLKLCTNVISIVGMCSWFKAMYKNYEIYRYWHYANASFYKNTSWCAFRDPLLYICSEAFLIKLEKFEHSP